MARGPRRLPPRALPTVRATRRGKLPFAAATSDLAAGLAPVKMAISMRCVVAGTAKERTCSTLFERRRNLRDGRLH